MYNHKIGKRNLCRDSVFLFSGFIADLRGKQFLFVFVVKNSNLSTVSQL